MCMPSYIHLSLSRVLPLSPYLFAALQPVTANI